MRAAGSGPRDEEAMRRAVRIYLHRGMERERLSFAERARGEWRKRLRYFTTLGWRVIALGCEEGAAVIHLRVPAGLR